MSVTAPTNSSLPGIDRRASQGVEMLHRAIRHQKPVFMLEILVVAGRLIDRPSHGGSIFRMRTLEDQLKRRLRRGVALENSKCLRCPDDLSRGDVPAEAPRVAQFLR